MKEKCQLHIDDSHFYLAMMMTTMTTTIKSIYVQFIFCGQHKSILLLRLNITFFVHRTGNEQISAIGMKSSTFLCTAKVKPFIFLSFFYCCLRTRSPSIVIFVMPRRIFLSIPTNSMLFNNFIKLFFSNVFLKFMPYHYSVSCVINRLRQILLTVNYGINVCVFIHK